MTSQDELEKKVIGLKKILEDYRLLIDSPLVNFYKDEHWKYIEDLDWSVPLSKLPLEELIHLPSPAYSKKRFDVTDHYETLGFPPNFIKFMSDVLFHSLPMTPPHMDESKAFIKLGMSPKKQHEVRVMSDKIKEILVATNTNQIIDFGSGKGYLPEHVALTTPSCNVVGLDCKEVNTQGALNRNHTMNKFWLPLLKKHHPDDYAIISDDKLNHYLPLTKTLSADDISERFVLDISSESEGRLHVKDTMLVGLHACGDLTALLLQTFLTSSHLKSIVSIGCCYHIITQRERTRYYMTEGEYKIPKQVPDRSAIHAFPLSSFIKQDPYYFSRNALNLAGQAPERMATLGKLPDQKNIFFRSVFQVLLCENFTRPTDMNVGHSATNAVDFISYTKLALKKLGLDNHLSDSVIYSYHERFHSQEQQLYIFYQLRTLMTRVIESYILIDRVLYLLEHNVHCEIFSLFDPVISPRCYVLVASKV